MNSKKSKISFGSELSENDITKLLQVIQELEKDENSYPFLSPVNYVELSLMDYPLIIKKKMDLGTVKMKLKDKKYTSIKNFNDDISLIWTNCKSYNIPRSPIYSNAVHCEKKFKFLMERKFRYSNKKKPNFDTIPPTKEKPINKVQELSIPQKLALIDALRQLSNEELTQVVKFIISKNPKVIEDINDDFSKFSVDLLNNEIYYEIMDIIQNFLKKEKRSVKKKKYNN